MSNNNSIYDNWISNNPNSNAKVYFLDGQLGTPKGDSSFQTILNSLPKPASNDYQYGILPQASTLPTTRLPPHYDQAPKQLTRMVLSQGDVGIQATPGVQVTRTSAQTQVEKSVGTGCNTCPNANTNTNAANHVTLITPGPRPQYVPVVYPNAAQGWYMQGARNQQNPIIRTTDEIRYPTVPLDTKTNSATTSTDAVEKQEIFKTQAVRTDSSESSNLGEIRTIGAILTLIGSLTLGLGIAGVVLYHIGKGLNSGLSWCYDAHVSDNSLTMAVRESSPGINYVTSGAGILGLLTFIVGVMTMNLQTTQGSLPIATMWMSIIDIPILVLMAILSLLSFIMTFRNSGEQPTCVPLTVCSCLVVFMGALTFTLIFVIYCKMQAHYYSQRSPGYQNQEPPLSKISVVKVNASMVQPCTCECCPCCMPSSASCCPGCVPHMREDHYNDDHNVRAVTNPVVVTGSNEAPIVKHPCPNDQYVWGQVTPYGHFNRPVLYTSYNYRMQAK